MNKQQVKTIIDELAGRCHCYDSCNPNFKHPILLGDVLEKIVNIPTGASTPKEITEVNKKKDSLMSRLIDLWGACFTDEDLEEKTGLSKSLQEIIKQSGWEVGKCATPTSCPPPTRAMCVGHEVLKSPEATELFEFLYQVTIK